MGRPGPTGPIVHRRRLLAALLLCLRMAAAPVVAQGGEPEPRFDAGVSTPAIPIRLRSNKVHVRVSVGGAPPEWFLLDSGANMTILDRELAERLGLELRSPTLAGGAAGGRPFEVAFTDIPRYRLAGVEIPPHPVAVIARRTQAANGHASAGLLGADLFRRFVVDVDYPAGTLRLIAPESFEYEGDGTVLPIRIDGNGKALVQASIEPHGRPPLAAPLTVDTGARGLLTLSSGFVAEHDLVASLPRARLATVGVGVGGEVQHWIGRLAALRLGPLRFTDLPVELAPAGESGAYAVGTRVGVLNAELLTRFRVIFDYARERIVLEARELSEAPFEADMSGLFLVAEPPGFDRPTVLSVLDGSPAAAAGLAVGDEIVAVDGRPASAVPLDALRELLKRHGERRRLRVRRGGVERDVTLRLRRLI